MRPSRHLTALVLPLVVVASLAACSSGADPSASPGDPASSSGPGTSAEGDAPAADAAQAPDGGTEGADGGTGPEENADGEAGAGDGGAGADGGAGDGGSGGTGGSGARDGARGGGSGGGAGADCFPGTWTAPASELLAAENVGDGTVTLDGEARIELAADGSFTYALERFSGRVTGEGTALLMTAIADAKRGTWQLADDHATVTEAASNTPWRLQMTGTVGGATLGVADGAVQDMDLVAPADARLECAGDELRLVDDTGRADVFHRD